MAVAALSAAGTLLPATPGRPVWLLATVGEEGLGNLRGIIAALDGFGRPVEAVLAVEGNYLGRVSAVGRRVGPVAREAVRPRRSRLGGRRRAERRACGRRHDRATSRPSPSPARAPP